MKRKIPITETELKSQNYSYVTEVGSWNRAGVAWQVWKKDSQLIIYDPLSQHVVGDLTKLIIEFYENGCWGHSSSLIGFQLTKPPP